MTQYSEQDLQNATKAIMARSRTDMDFRKLALTDPNAAIKAATQLNVPPGFKIRFIESEGANMVMTLPEVGSEEGELADTELEQVAGGRSSGPNYAKLVQTCPDGYFLDDAGDCVPNSSRK